MAGIKMSEQAVLMYTGEMPLSRAGGLLIRAYGL
jgi:hypothetical protein